MKISSADTFSAASTLPTTRPGPTPRRWIHDISAIAASATSACRENDQRHERQRDREERRRVGGRRHEAAEVEREHDRARGDRAGEAGDERRPAGEERREPAVAARR